ncbi:MAG: hypothetical protein GXY70_02935 [Euryarchaeota archaeon]|nr:hypothetical protein [Euryarchaeota archaeon]
MANISMSQALLAAIIVVMLISAAFLSQAEDDEEGGDVMRPEGTFTYSVTMEMDGMVYEGTFVYSTFASGNVLTWENETFGQWMEGMRHNYSEPSSLVFLHPFGTGMFPTKIDKVQMDTPWGEKRLDRSMLLWPDMEGGFLMRVAYGGADTRIAYREDVITERWRANFLLTEFEGTDLTGKDLEWSDLTTDLGNSRQHYGNVWTMLGEDEVRLMRTDGKVYNVSVKNYAYYHFSQDVMMDMFEGGTLRYDEERSVIGNGSVEFELDGQWYLRVIVPVGDQPNVFMMETRD